MADNKSEINRTVGLGSTIGSESNGSESKSGSPVSRRRFLGLAVGGGAAVVLSRLLGEMKSERPETDQQRELRTAWEKPAEDQVVSNLEVIEEGAKLRNLRSAEPSSLSEEGNLSKGTKVDKALKYEGPDPTGQSEKSTWYGFMDNKGRPVFSHASNFKIEEGK